MSLGTHHVVVQSWDTAGGIHKADVYVNVKSEAVVVATPTPNAVVASAVPVSATAGGVSTVHTMQVYLNNVLRYQVSGNAVNTTLATGGGKLYVVVQAWDQSGGITKTGLNVTSQGPTIGIASPTTGGWFYPPVQVTATASGPMPVRCVQVYVDSVLKYEDSGTGV